MIKLDVLRLLEERGKTKYWLYKQLGMSYQKTVNLKTAKRAVRFITDVKIAELKKAKL